MKIEITSSGEDEFKRSVSIEHPDAITKEEIIEWFDNIAMPGLGYQREGGGNDQ